MDRPPSRQPRQHRRQPTTASYQVQDDCFLHFIVPTSTDGHQPSAIPWTSLIFRCESQASHDELNLSTNGVRELATTIKPLVRDSNHDQSDIFQSSCCQHPFESGGDVDGPSTQSMTSNLEYWMDPLAFLHQPINTQILATHAQPSRTTLPLVSPANIDDDDEATRILSSFEFMKRILSNRGYQFVTIKSSEVGYMTDPSPLQLASFGPILASAVHRSDVQLLSSLLECGLSPNPCNQFRDCLLGWVCMKSQEQVLACFLNHQADIRVCDGFGRTPLHYAARASTFSPTIVAAILLRDPIQLFLENNAGRTPLEYVSSDLATQWIDFLDQHKDQLFPVNGPPLTVTKREKGMQLPDPPNALSVDLARLVASGQVQPEQIAGLDELTRKTWKLRE